MSGQPLPFLLAPATTPPAGPGDVAESGRSPAAWRVALVLLYGSRVSAIAPLAELADTLRRYRLAYLVTVSPENRPHVVAVTAVLANDRLRVVELGGKSRANLADRSVVTFVWPPPEPGGYTLIVDGVADRGGDEVMVTPTRAVLHRAAQRSAEPTYSADGGCRGDCIEVPLTSS